MTTPLQKALLISQARYKGTVDGEDLSDFDRMPLPGPGEVREAMPFREKPRQKIKETSQSTKNRVNRNVMESSIEALFLEYGTITADHYNIGCRFALELAKNAPKLTGSYGDRISGGNAKSAVDNQNCAATIIANIEDMMSPNNYLAVYMLCHPNIDAPMCDIAMAMQRRGIRGWSINNRAKKMCEALDDLCRVWRMARKTPRTEIKAA